MGDQEKVGLATMGAFFRRYVGGEIAFDPYMTGELSADGAHPQIPAVGLPDQSTSGARIACVERLHDELLRRRRPSARDVMRPETDNPLTVERARDGDHRQRLRQPVPRRRRRQPAAGRPRRAASTGATRSRRTSRPRQLGVPGLPTATKGCPLPAASALGGQNGTRESAPVNHSYGLQLALAWDQPAVDRAPASRPRRAT